MTSSSFLIPPTTRSLIAYVFEMVAPFVVVFLRGHLKWGRYLFWFFKSEEVVIIVCSDFDGFFKH